MSSSPRSKGATGARRSVAEPSSATTSGIKYYAGYFFFNEKGEICGGPHLTRWTTIIVEQKRTFRLLVGSDHQKDADANAFGDITYQRIFRSECGKFYRAFTFGEDNPDCPKIVGRTTAWE